MSIWISSGYAIHRETTEAPNTKPYHPLPDGVLNVLIRAGNAPREYVLEVMEPPSWPPRPRSLLHGLVLEEVLINGQRVLQATNINKIIGDHALVSWTIERLEMKLTDPTHLGRQQTFFVKSDTLEWKPVISSEQEGEVIDFAASSKYTSWTWREVD